ncbi:MAG TPA: ABC transporter substrate-binding protein [Pseudonocardiaceae bacterium]|nr:ABC transporter substrate-binding protein [Pseudonocardiaceae bacterium]
MALRPSANFRTPAGQRRGRRLRMVGAAALIGSSLLLATSCSLLNGSSSSSSNSTTGSGPVEHPNLTIGILAVTDSVPIEIALQKGYFKAEGLNVKIKIIVSGTVAVPDVDSGTVDIGQSNWATLFAAQANKTNNFKIVADSSEGQAGTMELTTYPGSPIHTMQDLPGHTISTNALSDVPFLALKAILQANSVDISKVKIVVVHHPDTEAALANHTVDAAIQLEPFKTLTAEKIGARPVVDLFGPGPAANLPIAGFFSTAKFAQQNPKTVAAFARAVEKGAADAAASRKLVEQTIPTFTTIDKQTAALLNLPLYPTSLDAKRLQRVADLMQTYGLLQNHLDVSSMVVATPPAQ